MVDAGRVRAGDVEAACAADEDEVGCCRGFVGEDEFADGFEERHCVLLDTRAIRTVELGRTVEKSSCTSGMWSVF